MDWKNQLTKTPYLVLFIVLISVGVGTASALITITLAGDVIITDNLLVEGEAKVTGSSIISERISVNTDNFVIQRPEGATADTPRFVLSHRTNDKDLWLYGFDGTTFKNFVGFDYPNYKIIFPANGNTLVIDAENDKVGIGTDSPSSELEVVGDVIVSGNYTFSNNQTRSVLITGHAFVPLRNAELEYNTAGIINFHHKSVNGEVVEAKTPLYGIPHGATIKKLSCTFRDNDSSFDIFIQCALYSGSYDINILRMITSTTTSGINDAQTISVDGQSFVYDSSKQHTLYLKYQPATNNCSDFKCPFYGMTIEYEVSKAD